MNSFFSVKYQPRWNGTYKWYVVPACIFIVARFVAQFSWNTNVVGSDDPMDTKHFVLTLF